MRKPKDGAAPARTGREERRSQSRHAPNFPLFWRDWLSSPKIRALDPDGRGRFLDVLCYTQGTERVGVMSEEQVRVWAGYTGEEWASRREAFLVLFRVRPDGLWVQQRTRREHLAQKLRYRRAKRAAQEAARKRWRGGDLDAVRIRGGMPTAPVETPPCPLPSPSTDRTPVPSPVPRAKASDRAREGEVDFPGAPAVGQLLGTVMARLGSEPGER